jgi:hypothetical protein
MKQLLVGVYLVCSNKSPWFKLGLGPGAYIQVSDFILLLLFKMNIFVSHVYCFMYNCIYIKTSIQKMLLHVLNKLFKAEIYVNYCVTLKRRHIGVTFDGGVSVVVGIP